MAFVEVEGSTGQIDVNKYRQLLEYVQEELIETKTHRTLVKGTLVGNDYRSLSPEDMSGLIRSCLKAANIFANSFANELLSTGRYAATC